jgi:hypothetical protein
MSFVLHRVREKYKGARDKRSMSPRLEVLVGEG